MGVKIIGILNLNNESFYDGGKYTDTAKALEKCKEMIQEGADIIELGGFSTKPGSIVPSINEELRRIMPVLEEINKLGFPISIETTRKEIVIEVTKYQNVIMINDTSGLKDLEIPNILKKRKGISYVLMHNPTEYHLINNLDPYYEDVVKDVYDFLEKKINYMKNIDFNNIIIDPGFFFNKGVKDNVMLIEKLDKFHALGFPLFIAISRKSCILEIENCDSNLALIETCIMNFQCIRKGATYIRVHDIKELKHTFTLSSLFI